MVDDADFRTFDEYVRFCLDCGLGPDISCYSPCPWTLGEDTDPVVAAGACWVDRQVAGGQLNFLVKLLMRYCGVENPQRGAISVSDNRVERRSRCAFSSRMSAISFWTDVPSFARKILSTCVCESPTCL